MKGRNTTVLGIRVEDELYLKIKDLAQKDGLLPSHWAKKMLSEAVNKAEGKMKEADVNIAEPA